MLAFNPIDLPRRAKSALFMGMDAALVPLALLGAMALRGLPFPGAGAAALLTGLGLLIFLALRLPWIKLHALERRAIARIAAGAGALAAAGIAVLGPGPALLLGCLFFCGALTARLVALTVLETLWPAPARERVAIYGAGRAGMQLAAALRDGGEARPILFVDDDPTLHGMMIAGLPVHAPARLPDLIASRSLARVLLAMPSVAGEARAALLRRLEALPVPVQVLPPLGEMLAGRGTGALRPVDPDALLGRDQVRLDIPEMARTYAGRVVLVTGAGGSIGSELCRQLLGCGPARLVLLDHSEFNLYAIHRDLEPGAARSCVPLTTRLGSITDREAMTRLMVEQGVEIVLHAAAYKHVPLVEENALAGAANNVLGTQVTAEAAARVGVQRFILVSTDKAVRPPNVMGATKRLSELVVQDLQTRHPGTRFSMVRFGNVLGSSGSVLPLFERQIAAGGPVTVTDPEVTRFFMTIPEAARLVLLAGAYARGRDLFVLDMGRPQRILDIAHRMVALAGRQVRDPVTGQGDIEIRITGLRPGEKLHEELLIDDDSLRPTPHPKILRAEEAGLSELEVARALRELRAALVSNAPWQLRATLARVVEGYPGGAPAEDTPLCPVPAVAAAAMGRGAVAGPGVL